MGSVIFTDFRRKGKNVKIIVDIIVFSFLVFFWPPLLSPVFAPPPECNHLFMHNIEKIDECQKKLTNHKQTKKFRKQTRYTGTLELAKKLWSSKFENIPLDMRT